MDFVLYQNLQTSPLCLNIVKSILCHLEWTVQRNSWPGLIVLIKIAPLEYQQVTMHRNGPSRLPNAAKVW